MTVFVARQPIFDRQEKVVAYELLHRSTARHTSFHDIDGDRATIEVLHNSFLNIGIDRMAEGKRLFVNFTENLLLMDLPSFLPNEKVVIEILEDIEASEELLYACGKLKEKGYLIALDDFILHDQNAALLPFTDIIKVDFLLTTRSQRQAMKQRITRTSIKWLAEKVETREQHQEALEDGFDFFQGFFFSKPSTMSADAIPQTINSHFLILKEMAVTQADVNKISSIIEKDLSLSYQLLKLLNKVAYKRRGKIKTIHQAVMMIGLDELKKWISFILLNDTGPKCTKEIIRTSLIRARTLEEIAKLCNQKQQSAHYFMTGMFSMIHALIARPLEEILAELPIDTEVKNGLLSSESILYRTLDVIKLVERGNWQQAVTNCVHVGINPNAFFACYHEAIRWSDQILRKETSKELS
ncbi:EAL and modified HD-GYP domain-containing signal transduction protein [Bacillus ectoiniformans]|uniref:EAL and HDOD domain-containing protein n=1 Tax=Bacillus ectoiniformans TaxID=1494429 RepID=UPI00195EDF6D|nr:HDOD domain-containing protein [Bacillus ectoiniformans]MBM7647751.1 EAL and modified HD-GYP domain-containing signal transduction protein [Bacillus ectoiniformans]